MKPLMRRTVFGEKNDAAIVPPAAWPQVRIKPFQDRTTFGIDLVTRRLSPIVHPGKQLQLFLRWRGRALRRLFDGFRLGGLDLSIVGIILFRLENGLAQDALR